MYRIALELLKNCNLRCKYCFVNHSSEVMDIDLAKKSIDFQIDRALQLKEKDIKFTFFGGEPLIKFDMIKELTIYTQKICKNNTLLNVDFDLVTNGLLFTREVSEFFIENKFTVGISLDGTPEDHNLNRLDTLGNPSYYNIMKNLDNIKHYEEKTGKPVKVSMTVCKNTYRNFFENFKHIVDRGFRIIGTALEGYGYWDEDEWTKEDFKELEIQFQKCIDLFVKRAKDGNPFDWTFVSAGLIPQLKKRDHYYCGCGILNNFITTDGSIYPCTSCTKEAAKIGHISEGIYAKEIKKFLNYKRKLSEICSKCDIKDFCSSCECLMMNLEITGDYHEVPFVFCELSKMRYKLTKKLLEDSKYSDVIEKYKNAI